MKNNSDLCDYSRYRAMCWGKLSFGRFENNIFGGFSFVCTSIHLKALKTTFANVSESHLHDRLSPHNTRNRALSHLSIHDYILLRKKNYKTTDIIKQQSLRRRQTIRLPRTSYACSFHSRTLTPKIVWGMSSYPQQSIVILQHKFHPKLDLPVRIAKLVFFHSNSDLFV